MKRKSFPVSHSPLSVIPFLLSVFVLCGSMFGCQSEEAVVMPLGCENCVDFTGAKTTEDRKKILENSRCGSKPGSDQMQCFQCIKDTHCSENEICTKNRCVCKNDKGCSDGSFCKNGTCVECKTDDHCKTKYPKAGAPDKQVCLDNACRGECRADADCAGNSNGEFCLNFYCKTCKPGSTRGCITKDVCNGLQTCLTSGSWGECGGGQGPQKEICDGRDNDCNGKVDDGQSNGNTWKAVGTNCEETKSKDCKLKGKWTCNAKQDGVYCKSEPNGNKEVCNGKDDDCDGQTDEDLKAPPCPNQKGVCKGSVQVCGEKDGKFGWLPCDDTAYKKHSKDYDAVNDGQTPATCDGKDNNCNGKVDESPSPAKPGSCTITKGPNGDIKGECSKGTHTCKDSKPICEPAKPSNEICDGKDNNCNGQVDETWADLGKECTVGKGVCAKKSKFVCNAAKNGVDCPVKPGTGTAEVCDGLDNDCDGLIDNKVQDKACTIPGRVGDCGKGTDRCVAGKWTGCVTKVNPKPEIFDNKDNDCDGFVDEGIVTTLFQPKDKKGSLTDVDGIAVDSKGNVYYSVEGDNIIYKWDATSKAISVFAGNGKRTTTNSLSRLTASFPKPRDIAFDSTGTHLYVVERSNDIRRIDGVSGAVSSYNVTGSMDDPQYVTVGNNGMVYVATAKSKLHTIDNKGQIKDVTSTALPSSSTNGGNYGIAAAKNGSVLSLQLTCGSTNCQTLNSVGQSSVTSSSVKACNSLCEDPSAYYRNLAAHGDSYYAVFNEDEIFLLMEKGKVSIKRVAGAVKQRGQYFGDKDLAVKAGFRSIGSIAFDQQGNLYIADNGNKRIRVVKAPFF